MKNIVVVKVPVMNRIIYQNGFFIHKTKKPEIYSIGLKSERIWVWCSRGGGGGSKCFMKPKKPKNVKFMKQKHKDAQNKFCCRGGN